MSTRTTVVVLAAALAAGACADKGAAPVASPSPSPSGLSEDQKTLYAMGAMLGGNLAMLKLGDAQLDQVIAGLRDAAKGAKLEVEPQAQQMQIQQLFQAKQLEAAQGEKTKGKAYQESASKEEGAVTLPNGMVYRTLSPGKGQSPKATDTVRVHYTGTFVDGKVFDSSVQRGQPAEFQVGQVITCWREGVQRMKVGEKAKLVCPSDTAYGDQGRPQIPGGSTLIFEVELLGIASGRAGK
jgi:FKBP-type peptidyl-prolyl cis-trans isomerase FkpA